MKPQPAWSRPCARSTVRRWGGALALLALLAQWLLLVASTTHHAQIAAAQSPWATVCRASVADAPAQESPTTQAGGCPICSAATMVAAPQAVPDRPAAPGCAPLLARLADASAPARPHRRPPARAPPLA
jgi:hypothetical protein